MLLGFHELNIDDKNRLSIPASFRAAMEAEDEGTRLYLAPGQRDKTLELFPEKAFKEFVEKELGESMMRTAEARDFRTFFLAMSAPLDIDKQGRVLLPQQHLKYIGIGKEILLTGDMDRLVMWNRVDGLRFIDKGCLTISEKKKAMDESGRAAAANGGAGGGSI